MSGLCAAAAEALLKAGRAEVVTALSRAVERFHVGCSAIKTADLAHEGARQKRRGIDALELVMEPKGGPVNVRQERLYIGRCACDDGFQLREALAKGSTFCLSFLPA